MLGSTLRDQAEKLSALCEACSFFFDVQIPIDADDLEIVVLKAIDPFSAHRRITVCFDDEEVVLVASTHAGTKETEIFEFRLVGGSLGEDLLSHIRVLCARRLEYPVPNTRRIGLKV
jgi:hypothetical protein